MSLEISSKDLNKFIVVGDRVLIRPKSPQERTAAGLFLPPSVQEKEKIYSGYVLKTGPGIAVPALNEVDEPWKESGDKARYVPLQAREGDLAIYLQKSAYEIEFQEEKYVIIPHSAILLLFRDEELFE
jgi:chaperonin GroES